MRAELLKKTGGQNTNVAPVATASAHRDAPRVDAPWVRENYSKFEYRIPMRDGIKLFASVYIPKDVFSDDQTYPIMLQRTPYNVAPYGADRYRAALGPSEFFAHDKFIFVYQDVRGRFMSEGEHTLARYYKPLKGPRDIDECTDCYDTVEWLIKNVPGARAHVGMWGISQTGAYTTAGIIDGHPAIAAVSPQAAATDYYSDLTYRNGAFMLAHNFVFYQGFRQREAGPAQPAAPLRFDVGTLDGYEFFLSLGSLRDAEDKYYKQAEGFWEQTLKHPAYDEFWQSRSIWAHLKSITPAVMVVGGWYDEKVLHGPFREFDVFSNGQAASRVMLVMGPWDHGGFIRNGDRLGNVTFGSNTSAYYREHIEFPWFAYHLKNRGSGEFPQAWVFQTGMNQWRKLDQWPPKSARRTMYPAAMGGLSTLAAESQTDDEYISDPNKPVPSFSTITMTLPNDCMVSDQRYAAARPDVLVYKTEPLERDVTIAGPIWIDFKVSTTGTDSDFDVKLIDVYPGDYPDMLNSASPSSGSSQLRAVYTPMGGYQQLVRGEPFRGKYRKSFELPVPFEPGKPDRIRFKMPDVMHTFCVGHRIMVQVQSSWFPLTDRNPQKFMDINDAKPGDFQKATQRIFIGGSDGSRIEFAVME